MDDMDELIDKQHELWKEQCSMAEQIVSTLDISIVTCGHCSTTFLAHYDEDTFTCPICLSELDPSDCPDLFHDRSREDLVNAEKFHGTLAKRKFQS